MIIRHDDDGASGLVINRFTKLPSPREVLALFNKGVPEGEVWVAVHIGGPVQPASTMVLHSAEFQVGQTGGESDLFGGSPTVDTVIAIASGKESLKTLIFSGGSGWGPGQLEQEIDSGSWVLTDADRDLVISDDPSSFWQTAQARIRVDLEDNLYNGQTQRIIGTATATMMISSGSPTRQ